jgi:hypothetical protein
LNLDIRILFLCVREWAISKHWATGQHRKVGFKPISDWAQIQGIQVDYALTDLGNQSAALYSKYRLSF